MIFFKICICKITCKPMGKFAEKLNLGKRVLPPGHVIQFIFYLIFQIKVLVTNLVQSC